MHKPDVSEAKHAKQNLRNKTKRKSAKVYRNQGKSTAQTRSLRGKERIIKFTEQSKTQTCKNFTGAKGRALQNRKTGRVEA